MFSGTKTQYSIRTCLSSQVKELEEILNSMSQSGWELFNLYETEIDEEYYSCAIFAKEAQEDVNDENDELSSLGYQSKMQKMISFQKDSYELFKYIQKKLKEKRQKISQIKALIDSTDESLRADLNEQMSKLIKEQDELKKSLNKMTSPESMMDKLTEEKVTIALSSELMGLVDPDIEENLIAKTVKIRQKLTQELGYIIPRIKFEEDENLQADEFLISVRGVPALKDMAFFGYRVFFEEDLELTKYPKNSIKAVDYITQRPVVWIEESKTKSFWAQGLDVSDYVAKILEYICIKYVAEILDYNDINRYLDCVSKDNLFLIENIVPDFVSISELKYILSNLIKEKVSIKDINFVFEKLNDLSDNENKEDLLDKIRIALSRTISKDLANDDGSINVYILSEKTLSFIQKEFCAKDGIIEIKEAKLLPLFKKIKKIQDKLSKEKDLLLVVPIEYRQVLQLLCSNSLNNVRFLAREEISFEYELIIEGEI